MLVLDAGQKPIEISGQSPTGEPRSGRQSPTGKPRSGRHVTQSKARVQSPGTCAGADGG